MEKRKNKRLKSLDGDSLLKKNEMKETKSKENPSIENLSLSRAAELYEIAMHIHFNLASM